MQPSVLLHLDEVRDTEGDLDCNHPRSLLKPRSLAA